MSCATEVEVTAPIVLTLPDASITLTLPDSGTVTVSSAADVVMDEQGQPILDESACFVKNE